MGIIQRPIFIANFSLPIDTDIIGHGSLAVDYLVLTNASYFWGVGSFLIFDDGFPRVIGVPSGDEILCVAGLIIIGYMGFLSLVGAQPHRVPLCDMQGFICWFMRKYDLMAILGLWFRGLCGEGLLQQFLGAFVLEGFSAFEGIDVVAVLGDLHC